MYTPSLLLILAVPLGLAPEREITQPDQEPRVLLFTDDAAGSKLVAETKFAVLSEQNEPLDRTTDVNAFTARLMHDHWSSVHVIAQAEDGEPPWGEALRGYVQRNADKPAFLHLWKVPVEAVEREDPFLATTAQVMWRRDRSVIGYSLAKNRAKKHEVVEAKVHPGLVFPDFKGIEFADPVVIGHEAIKQGDAAPQEDPKGRKNSTLTTCRRQRATALREQLHAAWRDIEEMTEMCTQIYGLTLKRKGDADELLECLVESFKHTNNGLLSPAYYRAHQGMAVCEKRHKEADKAPPAKSKPQ